MQWRVSQVWRTHKTDGICPLKRIHESRCVVICLPRYQVRPYPDELRVPDHNVQPLEPPDVFKNNRLLTLSAYTMVPLYPSRFVRLGWYCQSRFAAQMAQAPASAASLSGAAAGCRILETATCTWALAAPRHWSNLATPTAFRA